MSHAYVCERCHNVVKNSLERYSLRVECRRADARDRLFVQELQKVCVACARGVRDRLRGGDGLPPDLQEALF